MTSLIARLRARACQERGGRCFYCDFPMCIDGDRRSYARRHGITVRQAREFCCTAEHLLARKDGGRNVRANVVAACKLCNQRRHARRRSQQADVYLARVRRRVSKGKWHAVRIPK